MEMYDFTEMYTFVINQVIQNYDDYIDDPDKFIRASIEEFTDNSNTKIINDIYDVMRDDLETTIAEYENKWQ